MLMSVFVIVAVKYPAKSKTGEVAEFTIALAQQDMPSGIYYDRQFDWPTGEALWLDVPVVVVEAVLLGCATVVLRFAFKLGKNIRQIN